MAALWPIALKAARHPEAYLVQWEAEDVAKDAILELIEEIGRVHNPDHAKGFVATIAYRRAISLARSKSAARRRQPDALDFSSDSPPSAPELIQQAELLLLLRQARGGGNAPPIKCSLPTRRN